MLMDEDFGNDFEDVEISVSGELKLPKENKMMDSGDTESENETTVSGDTEIQNNDEAKSVSGEDKVFNTKDGELYNKENEQQINIYQKEHYKMQQMLLK